MTVKSTIWLDALGAEIRFYDVVGVRTRVIEAGTSGPHLIMLHGIGGHAESFSRNVVELGRHFQVHALDMLGHGLTDRPDVDYTVRVLSEHVREFMDARGIDRAHLLGQSLGGWAASWLTIDTPERVISLSLATTAGISTGTVEQGSSVDMAAKVQAVSQKSLLEPSLESVRERLEFLMYKPETVTDELVELRYRIMTRDANSMLKMVNAITSDVEEFQLTPEVLRSIETPVLVLWTTHNPTTSLAEARAAAEILPNSRLEVFEKCAHWPQFEAPEAFNRVVADFLTAQGDEGQ
jgi:2-hydroxy-6-oxonona-2,4-dienedioate hydrolase